MNTKQPLQNTSEESGDINKFDEERKVIGQTGIFEDNAREKEKNFLDHNISLRP